MLEGCSVGNGGSATTGDSADSDGNTASGSNAGRGGGAGRRVRCFFVSLLESSHHAKPTFGSNDENFDAETTCGSRLQNFDAEVVLLLLNDNAERVSNAKENSTPKQHHFYILSPQ